MGKASREKGARIERELVEMRKTLGVHAERRTQQISRTS
jgi:hypothetical protein